MIVSISWKQPQKLFFIISKVTKEKFMLQESLWKIWEVNVDNIVISKLVKKKHTLSIWLEV